VEILNAQTRPGILTVLNLSHPVFVAAVSAAQQSGLSVEEWLEHRVCYAMSEDEVMVADGLDSIAPWSLACADLFVNVVNNAPELLHGRWEILHSHVRIDRSLWCEPTITVGEAEDGEFNPPYLSSASVRAAWPRLCAKTFCV
jgi:hypothetical protein